jgi:hypothetical protein
MYAAYSRHIQGVSLAYLKWCNWLNLKGCDWLNSLKGCYWLNSKGVAGFFSEGEPFKRCCYMRLFDV